MEPIYIKHLMHFFLGTYLAFYQDYSLIHLYEKIKIAYVDLEASKILKEFNIYIQNIYQKRAFLLILHR